MLGGGFGQTLDTDLPNHRGSIEPRLRTTDLYHILEIKQE